MTRSVEFLLSFSWVRGFTRVGMLGAALIKGGVGGGGFRGWGFSGVWCGGG